MTKEEFVKLYNAMFGYYPNQVQPDVEIQKLWYESLKKLDYKKACQCLQKWVLHNKWQPTISDFVNFEIYGEDHYTALDAWNYAVMYMQDYSNCYEPKYEVFRSEDYQALLQERKAIIENQGYVSVSENYKDRLSSRYIKRIPNESIDSVVEKIGYGYFRDIVAYFSSESSYVECVEYKELKERFISLYKLAVSDQVAELLSLEKSDKMKLLTKQDEEKEKEKLLISLELDKLKKTDRIIEK